MSEPHNSEKAAFAVNMNGMWGVYLATLGFFFVASFFTEARLWGLNIWGYLPLSVRFVLLGFGLAAPVALWFRPVQLRSAGREADQDGQGARRYLWTGAAMLILFGALFYLLRTEIHILGDGYQHLSSVAGDNPLIRARNLGGTLVPVLIKKLIGGEGGAAALASYRLVSIAAGVLFLVCTLWIGGRLFGQPARSLLFTLGMASGGYMLLFFGYVENYSLLCVAVLLFTLIGLLVSRQKFAPWLVLIPLVLALFFHVLGLVLVPAALYLMVVRSRVGRRLKRLGAGTRWLLGLGVMIAAGFLFYHYYTQSYFVRFAFVPFFENRFTVDGYSLWSAKHIVDWLNLLVLLLPALLLLVVLVPNRAWRRLFAQTDYRFLLILIGTTLAATFLLDPKIGMPRDWDLFSLAGVPLAALLYLTLLEGKQSRAGGVTAALLACALGFLSLFPRAAAWHVPETGITVFRDYADLDTRRNRSGMSIMGEQLLLKGLVGEYRTAKKFWLTRYPEDEIARQAALMLNENRYQDATALSRKLIDLDPSLYIGWTFLGRAYLGVRANDSARAVLEIADGLNPHSPSVLNELGLAYFNVNELDKAERVWLESLSLSPDQYTPYWGLANLYKSKGDSAGYASNIIRAGSHPEALGNIVLELGEYYLTARRFEEANSAFSRALFKGADSAAIKSVLERYPQFKEWVQ